MRLLDWESRLRAWAHFRLGDPFEWGVTDCAIVCFEAVDCLRGGALAAAYRGRYGTRRGALKFQRKERVDLALALEAAGVFRCDDAPATGDIITLPHPDLPFLVGHVTLGSVCLSAHEADGVALARCADALAVAGATVWRIG